MLISKKTGLVVYEEKIGDTHEIRAWGRTMALYKESGENTYRVDNFHHGDNDKKYGKFIRKNSRFLQDLFGSTANTLSIKHEEYGIKICLDEDVCKIVSAEVRSEIYIPIAYEINGVVEGGMYAYIWRCDAAARMTNQYESLKHRPVTSIVTGMCMFGANIWGIDQYGVKHPLTNTFYVVPEGSCIESIWLDSDEFHPYENMMLSLLDLQMPIFKAMGKGQQKVFYQSVYEEYVLYGLQMLLSGQMSLVALCAYADHVRTRALKIKACVSDICKRHNMEFDNGESALTIIFGLGLDSNICGVDVVEHFINLHKVNLSDISGQKSNEKKNLIEQVFWSCIARLGAQTGSAGEVWRHIKAVVMQQDISHRYDFSSLLTLNFLNYAAKVAIVRKENPDGELCLSHPFHEKPMALAYKELHAETCGAILSLNWIPPVFVHGVFKDGLYYLEQGQGKKLLNNLIASDLLYLCGLEVGAEAIKDNDLKQEAALKLDDLLRSCHNHYSQTKILC